MAPKQKSKGQKQIMEENIATLQFYRNMMLGSGGIYAFGTYLFISTFYILDIVFLSFAVIIFIACYQFMLFMAKPNISETGQVIDGGTDLGMENGMGEPVKDVIIVTAACQILSLLSNYFWLLWIAIPLKAVWMLWVHVAAPWFFQPAPEVSEKKVKKLERKRMRN